MTGPAFILTAVSFTLLLIYLAIIGFLLDRAVLQLQRLLSWDKASASR